MLQDEERMKRAVNVVPSHSELNAMMARNPAEEELFNRLDAELPWPQIQLGALACPGCCIQSHVGHWPIAEMSPCSAVLSC